MVLKRFLKIIFGRENEETDDVYEKALKQGETLYGKKNKKKLTIQDFDKPKKKKRKENNV